VTDVPDPDEQESGRPQQPPGHRMPGWVRGLVVVGIVVAVLVAVAILVDGGHGPSRHVPGGTTGEVYSPAGHIPPVDHG